MNAVKIAEIAIKTSENGLRKDVSDAHRKIAYETYFLRKCGRRLNAGKSTKAGNVMRLKTPTTIRKPSTAEANTPECF